jgi:hypothetical protein
VYENPTQQRYVLANGDLAGSWNVHVQNPDGSLVSLDAAPTYWLDGRWSTQWYTGPKGANNMTDTAAMGPLEAENAHVPSLAYLPYLITGDRYYADEMKFWANDVLLSTFPDTRGGGQGLLNGNQPRGIGWGLRNMTDAAAYLPDSDPFKGYLAQKVENNLVWLDGLAANPGPLGVAWLAVDPPDSTTPYEVVSLWGYNYMAWAVYHANDQGFAGGTTWANQVAALQLRLFEDPTYNSAYAAPYRLAIGVRNASGGVDLFTTLSQSSAATAAYPANGAGGTPLAGYYGVDARLMALVGIKEGWSGAKPVYDTIMQAIDVLPAGTTGTPDLVKRAGWAVANV